MLLPKSPPAAYGVVVAVGPPKSPPAGVAVDVAPPNSPPPVVGFAPNNPPVLALPVLVNISLSLSTDYGLSDSKNIFFFFEIN